MPSRPLRPSERLRRRAARLATGKLVLLVSIIVVLLVVAHAIGLTGHLHLGALVRLVRGYRSIPFAAPLFVLAVAAGALVLPMTVLTIVGAVVFGLWLGSLVSWLGAMLGGAIAYYLARSLGADAVRRWLGERASALDDIACRHGFSAVLSLRLLPVAPFNVISFAAGIAHVPVREYMLGTAVGQLPFALLVSYFARTLLSIGHQGRRALFLAIAAAGVLVLLLGLLPARSRRRARRMRQAHRAG